MRKDIDHFLYDIIFKVIERFSEEEQLKLMNTINAMSGRLPLWITRSQFNEQSKILTPLEVIRYSYCFRHTDNYFVIMHNNEFVGYRQKEDFPHYMPINKIAEYVTDSKQSLNNGDLQEVLDTYRDNRVVNDLLKLIKKCLTSFQLKEIWNAYCDAIEMPKYKIFSMDELDIAMQMFGATDVVDLTDNKKGDKESFSLGDDFFIIRPLESISNDDPFTFFSERELWNLCFWLYRVRKDFGVYELREFYQRLENWKI